MKRFNYFAAALLAGSAMVALPALAQESASPDAQPPILKDGSGKSGSADTNAATGGKASGSVGAKDQKATEVSPGQKEPSGEGKAASEATDPMKRKPASKDAAGASEPTKKDESKAAAETKQRKQSGEDSAEATKRKQPTDATENATEAAPTKKNKDQAAEGQQPSSETTASIDITNEQKVEIRNVIREVKAEPVEVDFDVSVGVAVPTTVELRPLPPRIVEIVPAYRGYVYFVLADGRIIVVEPDTHKVVYVLVA
ncbi:DUF1236 domain-containing protein [Mesorhizobium sp. IMUNJ 23232]|uniref:DUF1236 domain-containing protein n=1 Tax=Mesorhizobium sp. IMUNJ 23232 TaxID=3376064 RepID=UPI0037B77345